jgi:sigma-B regulation protein RsbU (phosphoserine phosphatase)
VVEPVKLEPQRMTCMEIWGGNRAIDKYFEAPGLDIYVHSAPYKDSQIGGGDIYYLTSCASGRISRFLLADVSGHGESASAIALSLRDLLRQNVNKISQKQFVSEMNVEFGELGEDSKFATAVVATFFEPKKSLDISVAGHPYPIYYSASKRKWVHLDAAEFDEGLENLPLGIHDESNYPGRKISVAKEDMFLLYSDAFIESVNANDQMLGIKGVLEILNGADRLLPTAVIPFLRSKIGTMADGNLTDDDATMILGHFTSTKVRMRDNLMAPFRLLGDVCDNTHWRN